MSRGNWLTVVLAIVVAVLTVQATLSRSEQSRSQMRRLIDPDDSKPDWYNPKPAQR